MEEDLNNLNLLGLGEPTPGLVSSKLVELAPKNPTELISMAMRPTLGEAPASPMLRVLCADAATWRTNSFRISSKGNQPYHLRIASTVATLKEAFSSMVWDLVLVSGYMGNYRAHLDGIPEIADAYHRFRLLGGVLCTASLEKEGLDICEKLKELGVPRLYIPYAWGKPSEKIRVPLDLPNLTFTAERA